MLQNVSRGLRRRPGIAEQRADAEVVAVALDFNVCHVDENSAGL